MTEAATDSQRCSIDFTDEAWNTCHSLPADLQVELLDAIHNLARNPSAHPHRVRALGPQGMLFIYTHPQPPLEILYELKVGQDRRVLLLLHFAAPVTQKSKPVFISYSHEDAEWLRRVKMFLKPMEELDLVRVWDDTEIEPGSPWLDEITRSLTSAKVAVFLVSQSFLTSDFIQREELPALLERARARGVQIGWIAVSASTVKDNREIYRLQALNDPAHPLDSLPEPQQKKVLTDIYEKLKKMVAAA